MEKRKAARNQGGSNVKESAGSRATWNTRNSQDAAVLKEVLGRSTNETQVAAAHQLQVQNQSAAVNIPGAQPAVLLGSIVVDAPTSAPAQSQEMPSSQPAASMLTQASAEVEPAPALRQY